MTLSFHSNNNNNTLFIVTLSYYYSINLLVGILQYPNKIILLGNDSKEKCYLQTKHRLHGYKQGWNIKCLKEYLGKIHNIKSKKHINRIMYKLEQVFKKSHTSKAAFQAVTSTLSLMKIPQFELLLQ